MIDIATDLKERFDYAAYFYLSAWEHDPDTRIEDNVIVREDDAEQMLIDTFEALSDTVGAVPADLITNIEVLRSEIGPERYEQVVIGSIQMVGHCLLPSNATEFAKVLIARCGSL